MSAGTHGSPPVRTQTRFPASQPRSQAGSMPMQPARASLNVPNRAAQPKHPKEGFFSTRPPHLPHMQLHHSPPSAPQDPVRRTIDRIKTEHEPTRSIPNPNVAHERVGQMGMANYQGAMLPVSGPNMHSSPDAFRGSMLHSANPLSMSAGASQSNTIDLTGPGHATPPPQRNRIRVDYEMRSERDSPIQQQQPPAPKPADPPRRVDIMSMLNDDPPPVPQRQPPHPPPHSQQHHMPRDPYSDHSMHRGPPPQTSQYGAPVPRGAPVGPSGAEYEHMLQQKQRLHQQQQQPSSTQQPSLRTDDWPPGQNRYVRTPLSATPQGHVPSVSSPLVQHRQLEALSAAGGGMEYRPRDAGVPQPPPHSSPAQHMSSPPQPPHSQLAQQPNARPSGPPGPPLPGPPGPSASGPPGPPVAGYVASRRHSHTSSYVPQQEEMQRARQHQQMQHHATQHHGPMSPTGAVAATYGHPQHQQMQQHNAAQNHRPMSPADPVAIYGRPPPPQQQQQPQSALRGSPFPPGPPGPSPAQQERAPPPPPQHSQSQHSQSQQGGGYAQYQAEFAGGSMRAPTSTTGRLRRRRRRRRRRSSRGSSSSRAGLSRVRLRGAAAPCTAAEAGRRRRRRGSRRTGGTARRRRRRRRRGMARIEDGEGGGR